jgi:hypothetical protein
MQIEAIYDHGQLKFNRPVQFATEYFPVILQIPDAEVMSAPDSTAMEGSFITAPPIGGRLLEEIREILGPVSKCRPAVRVAEDQAALVEALEEKYGR